jgi:hypothetical protein
MIITNTGSIHTFRVIHRRGTASTVILQDEETKEETEHSVIPLEGDNDTELSINQPLQERRKYKLTVTDEDGNVLYRDLIQVVSLGSIRNAIDNYTINEGEYQLPEEEVTKTKYKII